MSKSVSLTVCVGPVKKRRKTDGGEVEDKGECLTDTEALIWQRPVAEAV